MYSTSTQNEMSIIQYDSKPFEYLHDTKQRVTPTPMIQVQSQSIIGTEADEYHRRHMISNSYHPYLELFVFYAQLWLKTVSIFVCTIRWQEIDPYVILRVSNRWGEQMIKKLLAMVTKRNKQIEDICSEFDKMQERIILQSLDKGKW